MTKFLHSPSVAHSQVRISKLRSFLIDGSGINESLTAAVTRSPDHSLGHQNSTHSQNAPKEGRYGGSGMGPCERSWISRILASEHRECAVFTDHINGTRCQGSQEYRIVLFLGLVIAARLSAQSMHAVPGVPEMSSCFFVSWSRRVYIFANNCTGKFKVTK